MKRLSTKRAKQESHLAKDSEIKELQAEVDKLKAYIVKMSESDDREARNAALSEAIEKLTKQIEKSQDGEIDDAGYKALEYFKVEILGILEGLKIKQ